MTARPLTLAAALALSGCLSGCATIVSGDTDAVNIDSEPRGQQCQVYQAGDVVARVTTPQTVPIERTTSGLLVVCGDSRKRVESGFNAWTLGNVLLFPPFGTAVGWIIDGISGASSGYDDVTVKMEG